MKKTLKFIACSLIGVFLFFVSIDGKVPMVHIMGYLQGLLGYPVQFVMVMITCILVLGASIYYKVGKNPPKFLEKVFGKDNFFSYFTYGTAAVFSTMVVTGCGPEWVLNQAIGNMSMEIACDSFAAILVAGTLVAFITEFGFLEFLGKLLEPFMRLLFRVPGKSAVDAISSFVIAPAAGVMITNDLYQKKVYTQREAAAITTNFSIASLGGFAFLSAIAGVDHLFSEVVLAAFIATVIMAMIMIRIPPIAWMKNTYIDGTAQEESARKVTKYGKNTVKDAVLEGLSKAESTGFSVFGKQLTNSVLFAMKVNAFIVSLSVICLILTTYTPICQWLAVPMAPILNLFGLADSEVIAASSVVGVFALSLPATLIAGKTVATASAFFIVVLSTCQIIFFTESANAMMESDIPVGFGKLVAIFVVRTIFLIPLVALLTHWLVG